MTHKNALRLLAGVLLGAIALSAAPSSQAAQCSQAGVAGRWGYTYTGVIVTSTGQIPVASVGSFRQDATGKISGSQTRSVGGASGVENIAGTVSVNADCTGSATVDVLDASGHVLRTAQFALVYVNGEREARFIFASLTQNGANVPVVITVNAKRISAEED